MPKIYPTRYSTNLTHKVILLSLLLSPSSAMAGGLASDACDEAIEVLPNTSLHRSSVSERNLNEKKTDLFKVEVPAAGLVVLEIATPPTIIGEGRIGLIDQECASTQSPVRSYEVLEEKISGLLVATRAPSTLLFRVAAQNPDLPLTIYQLSVGFLNTEINAGNAEQLGDLLKDDDGEDPGEIEIEPDLSVFPDGNHPALAELILEDVRRLLCQRMISDDYGDSFPCASELGPLTLGSAPRKASGEIANNWGDDLDLFTFDLSEIQVVNLASLGETDTIARLYDDRGHQLASNDDGGEGFNFRIVKTLAPGTYFLKVEGSQAARGTYTLLLEASNW